MSQEEDPKRKPKAERVREAVHLMKKLQEIGMNADEPGYVETKQRLDDWIKTGDAWSGWIRFIFFERKGELILPSRKGRVSTFHILAPEDPRH